MVPPGCTELDKNKCYDTYVNDISQPGWYQKLTRVYPGKFNPTEAYEPNSAIVELEQMGESGDTEENGLDKKLMDLYRISLNAYVPEDPIDNDDVRHACQEIESMKDLFCDKLIKGNNSGCNDNDTDDDLRKKHNLLMACRNVRAIESTSNCRISSRGHYKFPHDEGHLEQTVMRGTNAEKCRYIYKKRHSKPVSSMHKKSRKKRAIKNSRTQKRKPPSNFNTYLPPRSPSKHNIEK